MVHVALGGNIAVGPLDVEDALARYALDAGLPIPETHVFPTVLELVEHIANAVDPPLDLIILDATQPGMPAAQALRDARAAGYAGLILLMESSAAGAREAWRLSVDRYLVSPVDPAEFAIEATALLRQACDADAHSITLNARGGTYRVPFAQLVYAQTDNHDQVLHMLDGSTVQLRSSSQDLFERFSHDRRFLKLGSSYIVNLDFVESVRGNGATISFADGSSAPVPVRLRKATQDAVMKHGEWAKSPMQDGGGADA